MGRSVSVPYEAEVVEKIWIEEGLDSLDWDDFLINLKSELIGKYKSLTTCDKWLDREDRAILENELVYIGVSEYCGVVAIWIVPKFGEFYSNRSEKFALAKNFCNQISKGFKELLIKNYGRNVLRTLGTFSNGEAVYERVVR